MTTSKQSKWLPAEDAKASSELRIQPFTYPPSSWLGSSFVLGEFRFVTNMEFTVATRVVPPPGTFYVLALRFISIISGKMERYLLYRHPDCDVHYPDYSGEIISQEFAIEIWCCKGRAAINLYEWQIETGIMNLQIQCCGCQIGGEQISPSVDNLLFSPILPYGETPPPVGEPPMANLLIFDEPFHTPPSI